MPEIKDLFLSRPTVLETGEESILTVRGLGEDGRLHPVPAGLLRFSGDNPHVADVNGLVLRARAEGRARIRAFADLPSGTIERSWEVEVLPSRQTAAPANSGNGPRLLFTPAELEDFKGRISAANPETGTGIDFPLLWRRLLRKADEYVLEEQFVVAYPSVSNKLTVPLPLREPDPIPEPEGYVDYPFWTMFSRAVEERLHTLSVACLGTGDSRYAARIRMYLTGLAGFSKWYEFDHRGAEGNLSNAHFVIGAAIAYDSVRSLLDPDERRTIAGALLHRGLQPLAIDFGNDDMHNIIAAKQVAMMFGAAALAGECPQAAKYMEESRRYLASYLERRHSSGETEGLMYNNVAARHILMAADLYQRVTGDSSLCDHPYLKEELPEQYFRFLSPGRTNTFPNFSDSYEQLDLAYLMSMLASRHGNPLAMWYIREYEAGKLPVLLNLRRIPPAAGPDVHYGVFRSKVFESIGWAALRSGWGERDHLLCFTSGKSARGHNHKDQNNLMVNVAGEWLLTNPGYQDYVPGPRADYTVGTIGHNSLLVDGQGQPRRGGGCLEDSWMTPDFQAVRGEAGPSYDGLLDSYARTVFHWDNAYYLVVDDVALQREGQVPELLFHTRSKLMVGREEKKPGDECAGREVRVCGERAALRLIFLEPQGRSIRVCEYPGAESYGPHLSVKPGAAGLRQRFVTLVVPETGEERITAVQDDQPGTGGIVLTLGRPSGGKDRILLPAPGSGAAGEADIPGFRLRGAAAWLSLGENGEPLRAALWNGTLLEAGAPGAFRLETNVPVHAAVGTGAGGRLRIRCREQTRVRWTGFGGSNRQWMLEPGEHTLEV